MNKDKLEKLVAFVIELAQLDENDWFKKKLENHFSNINKDDYKSDSNITDEIKQDTSKIIHFLEINPSCSVDYSFIEHKLLRTRLELDNLRMENVRYDLKEKDEMKRLYDFCINAFYQIENLLNYYYFEQYQNFDDLLTHLESVYLTKFRRKEEKNIGDITIATKIYAFTKTHYTNADRYVGMNIDSLRQIRNEGLHRCTRIKNVENENEKLHKFIKYATFDSIHTIVESLSKKVRILLNK